MQPSNQSKRIAHNLASLLLFIAFSSVCHAQAGEPATVSASELGTYQMTFNSFTESSPIEHGAQVTFVLGLNNVLCVGDVLLSDPVMLNGNLHEGIWTDTNLQLDYAISSLIAGVNEIMVSDVNGEWYGQFQGERSSLDTNCAGYHDIASVNALFTLAEQHFGEYFPAGAEASINLGFENYIYRFYISTGIFLAIDDVNVYILGGAFGNEISIVGTLTGILGTLQAMPEDSPNSPNSPESPSSPSSPSSPESPSSPSSPSSPESPSSPSSPSSPVSPNSPNAPTTFVLPSVPEGFFTLTISGTVQVNVGGLQASATILGVTINNIAVPSPLNLDAVTVAITNALAGISGVVSLTINVVNISSDRVTFDATFTARASGVVGTYELRYDYQR